MINCMGQIDKLKKRAKILRNEIIKISSETGIGHLSGSFSVVEILVALYLERSKENDKIILSKGHGCLGLYPLLREKGFNPVVKAHPDIDEEHGIACTTGSLGHGLPIAVGMAFAKKYKKEEGHIFVILGDGECQEGTIWESLNLARKFKLDNLTIIVDYNKLQALDSVKETIGETNLKGKFESFGCNTFEIDGHDFEAILKSTAAKSIKVNLPRAIIAHTIKGKGVSFMENKAEWHTRLMNDDEMRKAYDELK